MNNRQKGAVGEKTALEYLQKKGYILIDKNWHFSKSAEIDLIMKDNETLVFIEVKSRITFCKQNMIDKFQKYKELGYKPKLLYEGIMYNDNEMV